MVDGAPKHEQLAATAAYLLMLLIQGLVQILPALILAPCTCICMLRLIQGWRQVVPVHTTLGSPAMIQMYVIFVTTCRNHTQRALCHDMSRLKST